MTINEQENKAKEFAEYWKGKGYEKGESQKFWLSLLSNIYGVVEPEKFIIFEDQVHLDHTSFIDGFIPSTHVLIEQKGLGKDLRKPIKQSDGTLLNPFQQAKRYAAELPYSQRPRWIVTCNFSNFLVYDMENPNGEPEEILLENLPKEFYRLQFLVEEGNKHLKREMEVSIQAGELVGKLYDEIHKLYINPDDVESLKSLNMLCVRLVFCLYAEDAGIFGKKGMFHDYLVNIESKNIRRALIDLFKVLDTKLNDRDPYLEENLAQFPYVNGGLFADENIEIPNLTENVKHLLLNQASDDFDWSEISPTIFGAVFESTLNPETRRSGGMHYTSIENIHKVIDPLFLDDLRQELEDIKAIPVLKTRKKKLKDYQSKLASLTFLDPACGSGNFLTETYLSLRKLENDTIQCLTGGQIGFGDETNNPIQVSIGQFYGIEINDFAVTVAKTALWIAESQMMKETENILHLTLDFLPLKSYTNITEANALRIDWNDVIDKNKLNYIMGNPPFVGKGSMRNENISGDLKNLKIDESLDYVAGWYFNAAKYIQNTKIHCAFVSTNSITQGEQVVPLWKPLMNEYRIIINFAYRTFKWNSEASIKAQVHCVIVGFSLENTENKIIFTSDNHQIKTTNINGYLLDSPNTFIQKRSNPICNVQSVISGNRPDDNGNYILNQEEMELFVKKYPDMEPYIKKYIGSREFINNIPRYCIWLDGIEPSIYKNNSEIMSRIRNVVEFRKQAKGKSLRKLAETPLIWKANKHNKSDYILLPRVSSQNRRYIPIGFINKEVIGNDSIQMLPNATIYDFGILTSNVHMSWVRTVAGRLKSDFRYSNTLVYNTFPWPNPTAEQKEKIEKTAQGILDARALYPNSSLSDLYDELTMPSELRKAHQANDRAVMEAYGFPVKNFTESMCVAELMKMYETLVKNN